MKNLFVLTILVLINFNLCAVDGQIALALSVATGTATNTIREIDTAGESKVKFYDNVITYKMKYFDSTLVEPTYVYDDDKGAAGTVLGETDYLYSFNRLDTDSQTSYYEDPTGGLSNSDLFVRYYPVQYKTGNKVDHAYIAFEIAVDCTDVVTGAPPMLTFEAKFFCSDEEAKAEYDEILESFPTDDNPSLAYVSTSGTCTSTSATRAYTGLAVGGVTVCQLLTGSNVAAAKCT